MEIREEYHDLCLKNDALLFGDVCENFRSKFISFFELYPVHYLSAPCYSWDPMLRFTGVNVKIISCIDKA